MRRTRYTFHRYVTDTLTVVTYDPATSRVAFDFPDGAPDAAEITQATVIGSALLTAEQVVRIVDILSGGDYAATEVGPGA